MQQPTFQWLRVCNWRQRNQPPLCRIVLLEVVVEDRARQESDVTDWTPASPSADVRAKPTANSPSSETGLREMLLATEDSIIAAIESVRYSRDWRAQFKRLLADVQRARAELS
jgi:hypothetical protein